MAIDPQLITTVSVDELPPSPFNLSDKLAHSIGGELYSGTIEDLVNIIRLNSNAFQYEIKMLSVTNQYVLDNFDSTGLGKNLCLGWAICNGNNGTDNDDGRMYMAYGTTNNVLKQTGGSKDAVVVEHTHSTRISNTTGSNTNTMTATNGGSNGGTTANNGSGIVSVSNTGVSGINKNLPPFRVILAIQKL